MRGRIEELNHVALHVGDVDRSRDFYGRVLGLPELPRPAFSFPGAWFALGAQELHLIGGSTSSAAGHRRGNHFALLVDDLQPWIDRLAAHQIVSEGPFERPDGARQLFFADPDGHMIELCTRPPAAGGGP